MTASTCAGRRPALLQDAQAFGADRRAAEIDQEARRVAHHHGHARLALAQRHHGVGHPWRGVGGADHLDQLHQGHGIEIVHAADALAVLQRARDRGDADRRGVGGKDGLGRDHGFELAEQLLLDLEVLEHGLDDDVAGLEVVELVGDGEIGVGLGKVGIGQPALGDEALQRLEDRGLRLRRTAGRGVEHDRLHATLRRHLRNTAPHRAGSDHAHDQIGAVHIESHLISLCLLLFRHLATLRPIWPLGFTHALAAIGCIQPIQYSEGTLGFAT